MGEPWLSAMAEGWMEGETKGSREAWTDQPANDLKHTEINSYSSHSPRKDMFEGTWGGGVCGGFHGENNMPRMFSPVTGKFTCTFSPPGTSSLFLNSPLRYHVRR